MSTARVLCYPHSLPWKGAKPPNSDLHETSGLPGNWALDFMAPGGTLYVAPEKGTISRWSGHDPAQGVIGGDIFGWNVYLETPDGVMYFATHLGSRTLHPGAVVKKGQVLGAVGHWPGDPGRSHTHLGVTHPGGVKASKLAICKVAAARRVTGTT